METPAPPPSDPIVRLWPRVRGAHVNVYDTRPVATADAPPLVLLHGGGLDSALLSWGPHLSYLAVCRRVLAPDLPGYGESETPDAPYTLPWYVDTLAALLDTLGVARADLCGVSLGGGIALGCALAYPARVRKLVLVSSYGLGARIPGGVFGALWVRVPGGNTAGEALIAHSPAVARAALRTLLVNDAAVTDALVTQSLAAARRPRASLAWTRFQRAETGWWHGGTDYRGRLRTLSVPTLLLHGENDRLVPPAAGIEAHARIPGSRLQVFSHCGHWLPRDQPERFQHTISQFLG